MMMDTEVLVGALAEAVEALEVLAQLGNEPYYGNSDGNRIAQAALAKINLRLAEDVEMAPPCTPVLMGP